MKITSALFYNDTRDELAKQIGEFKERVLAKMALLQVTDEPEKIHFEYSLLHAQRETLVFLEYYLLNKKERNWLCSVQTERPVKTMRKFENILQEVKEDIISKQPTCGLMYNSLYFIALHYLNKIEVQDDGT